ncbi:6-phosphofructokinase [Pseudomonas aeruginosa]|uniref:6-phosphofructokinase n=1 Tax=Pseudomonas aeruginosa TaxID=287 RepID=UPI002023883F|nr:6-phosphofructokinase [Pseudomonas aeruginosa]MCL8281996.1 6-phosphofructokinase [Pseudomonas aeruginosa]
MKIGIVISGGDVSGMNNFIFQIARQANADITLFNGGIPGLLEKSHQDMAWRDLVDYSITAVPIITSFSFTNLTLPANKRVLGSGGA